MGKVDKDTYYMIRQVYKNLIKKKTKRGEDVMPLRKRLLHLSIAYGKNKSTHKI